MADLKLDLMAAVALANPCATPEETAQPQYHAVSGGYSYLLTVDL